MPDLVVAQNVPQELLDRIVAAFVDQHGPIPKDQNGNPTMTANQFARSEIVKYIKTVVRNSEKSVASKTLGEAAATKADDDFKNV